MQQLYQIGWRTGLEPIATKSAFGKGAQQTIGIVDALAILHEVVAIVAATQAVGHLFRCHLVELGKIGYALFEILMELGLSDAADGLIAMVHRDVSDVVQVAEHRDLAELCDTRQEAQLNIGIC